MRSMISAISVIAVSIVNLWSAAAFSDTCLSGDRYCHPSGDSPDRSPSSPAYPNTQSSLDLNPAAVPVADQWGLEGIIYKGFPDLVVVHGTGRIGAAISPSNGEDTFFGNPSLETNASYLQRQQASDPYKSKKLALGLAGLLFDNGENDLTHVSLSLGVLARYNELTHSIKPGGGLSGILGPLSLGVSTSTDETKLDTVAGQTDGTVIKDTVFLYSVGLSFKSAALDYSMLKLTPKDQTPIQVRLMTGTILLQKWILTAAVRTETSDRPSYDSSTNSLIAKQVKTNYFGGVQYAVLPHVQIGLFYDYYLLHEIAGGLTVFL